MNRADLLLPIADDELILGWRNSEWTGIAPFLEEDVAFSSIAQNEIGHARALYELVAEELVTDADSLAFDREETYHRMHAEMWADRLRETPQFQEALQELWPEALGLLAEDLRPGMAERFGLPATVATERGEHAEDWPVLWEEMTEVRRSVPGATW